jgi:hypothetical protein
MRPNDTRLSRTKKPAHRPLLMSVVLVSLLATLAFATAAALIAPASASDSGIKLTIAPWVPKSDSYGRWGAVSTGGAADKVATAGKESTVLALPPGTYDVYWVQDYATSGSPLLLAAGVKVAAGDATEVKADSGIKLVVADWVPKRSDYGWWGAVRAGSKPDARVNWTKQNQALLLPPGAYDVYWVQEYETSGSPLLLAAGVKVAAGDATEVKADSGIKLAVADWVPKRSDYGWWGAVRAGSKPDARVNWTKQNQALLLPPGAYDVYWVQEYETSGSPLLLAVGVTVAAGDATEVKADSGIAIVPGTPPLDQKQGIWGASSAGAGPDKLVNWWRGAADNPLLLPPGTYDVYWKEGYASQLERRAQGIAVAAGERVVVEVGSATPPSNQSAALPSLVTDFRLVTAQGNSSGSTYPRGVAEVRAQYAWKDATVGTPLGVQWFSGDDKILENGEPIAQASGDTTWILEMSAGGELPGGNYHVVLVENGRPARSIPFTIGEAAAPAPTPRNPG